MFFVKKTAWFYQWNVNAEVIHGQQYWSGEEDGKDDAVGTAGEESSYAAVDAEHDDIDDIQPVQGTFEDVSSQRQVSPPKLADGGTAMAENPSKAVPIDRKPEDELFVLVDDDLDSDIISMHAAAFQRVDPFSDGDTEQVVLKLHHSTPSTSKGDAGDLEKETTESTNGPVTNLSAISAGDAVMESPSAADNSTKSSEKPAAKRLVYILNRLPSRLMVMTWCWWGGADERHSLETPLVLNFHVINVRFHGTGVTRQKQSSFFVLLLTI